VPTAVAHGLAAPQPLDELERLDEAAHALPRVQAERRVLGVTVAEPDTHDEPTAADHVQRRQLLGEVHRLMQRE